MGHKSPTIGPEYTKCNGRLDSLLFILVSKKPLCKTMWDTGNLYPQKFCLKKMFLKGVYVNWPSCLSRFSIWPEGLNPISFFTYLTKARLPQNNPGMQFYFRRWILLYSFFVLFWLSMLSIWFETKENWRENYRLNHRQKNAISIINIIIHDTVFIYAIIVFLAEVSSMTSLQYSTLFSFLFPRMRAREANAKNLPKEEDLGPRLFFAKKAAP